MQASAEDPNVLSWSPRRNALLCYSETYIPSLPFVYLPFRQHSMLRTSFTFLLFSLQILKISGRALFTTMPLSLELHSNVSTYFAFIRYMAVFSIDKMLSAVREWPLRFFISTTPNWIFKVKRALPHEILQHNFFFICMYTHTHTLCVCVLFIWWGGY